MPDRLNLGCGPVIAEGWVNADRDDWAGAMYADPLVGLPWTDGTFDGVVSHHVLQMVPWPSLVPWLREVRRVTAEGGWLRLSVPDVVGAFQAWEAQDVGWFPIHDLHEQSIDGKLCMYLTQAGATRSMFTWQHLVDVLLRAGWATAAPSRPDFTGGPSWLADLDNRPAESVYVEARR